MGELQRSDVGGQMSGLGDYSLISRISTSIIRHPSSGFHACRSLSSLGWSRTMNVARLLAVALALLLAPAGFAQEHAEHQDREHAQRAERGSGGEQRPHGLGVLALLPPNSTTEHTLDADGVKLAYTATAGTLNLYEQSGERTAAIFYTAYAVKGGA